MKNRSPAWMAAAAVTTLAQTLLFATILPRPAAATDLATPPRLVRHRRPRGSAGRAWQYLTSIAGCHDCHTEGYTEAGGNAPPARWFTGSSVGFKGPWGVSYPTTCASPCRS